MSIFRDKIEKLEKVKVVLISRARNEESGQSNAEYVDLRQQILSDPVLSKKTPLFIKTCSDLSQFWAYIKPKFPSYAERTKFITDEINPLILSMMDSASSPLSAEIERSLTVFSEGALRDLWARSIERIEGNDLDGAITLSRTLLESTLKHILDLKGTPYDDASDLPSLYKVVSSELNLHPSQHIEKMFKETLSGCVSVVKGLGSLRSKIGDAHGAGVKAFKPDRRHALLLVGLAGSLALFLIQTNDSRKFVKPTTST